MEVKQRFVAECQRYIAEEGIDLLTLFTRVRLVPGTRGK
jgi:hypothetical protein